MSFDEEFFYSMTFSSQASHPYFLTNGPSVVATDLITLQMGIMVGPEPGNLLPFPIFQARSKSKALHTSQDAPFQPNPRRPLMYAPVVLEENSA